MHLARPVAVLLALVATAASTAGCGQSDDEYYQYRTVTYSVSVVGPHDTLTVWYRAGKDIREEQPTSTDWQTTVKGRFYEPVSLDLRADAYMPENQSPVPPEVSCEIAVDGRTYAKNTYTTAAVCSVDLDEVTAAPAPAPTASTDEGTLTPLLWLGGGVLVTAIFFVRWAYVRRRRSRGSWPPAGRGG